MTSNNLFDILFEKAKGTPEKVCITTPEGRTITYGELIDASGQYANTLKTLGVEVGDRVAVQVDKSIEKLMLYLGVLRVGAVFLPLNTAYTLSELSFFIGDAEPSVIVCRKSHLTDLSGVSNRAKVETLEADGTGSLVNKAATQVHEFETVARSKDDLAAILYTSGTTGRSKGAMISHWNLARNIKDLEKTWHYSADDILIHALPIFHTHGLFVACNLTFLTGASMFFLDKYDADTILDLMPKATAMMGVPTFYSRLLARPEFTKELASTMRVFISGSAPMTVEVHKRFTKRTGKIVLERYGMTETGMNCSNPYAPEDSRRQGTVGFPLGDMQLRIADSETGTVLPTGEIGILEVKGDNVFQGYWQLPDKTASEFRPDGFFITGDMGFIDEDGYITLVGRSKDLIISGGFNVYPKEVETVINAIDGVNESAVIGLPDDDWGERVAAVIVLENELSKDDIAATLKENLAAYKLPKQIEFVDELPRNTMGKVQKKALRQHYS